MKAACFTIIIPTYKRPALLQRAIDSARKQTWPDLSILVLDNASEDETKETVLKMQKKDARIQYVCHAQNIGMLSQYQYGIEHVQTEFFSFLSDDDLLLPSFCETSIRGFEQFPDCCFFASSSIIYSKLKGILKVPLALWPTEGRYPPILGAYEMIGKYPVPNTVAFRKSFLSTVFVDTQNSARWDCDFLLQLSSRFPFAISKKVTGIFFSHPGSFTSSMTHNVSYNSMLRIIERAPTIEPANPLKLAYLLKKELLVFLGSIRKFADGYAIAKQLIKHSPLSLKNWVFFTALAILKTFPRLHIFVRFMQKGLNAKETQQFRKYEHYLDEIS